jgi:CMP-N,N'-diacetyllegionaminic acid synthase
MAPGSLMKQTKMMAIIPARGGSKGLPRKNLRPLGGIPLIAWTINAAKESPLIDLVVITSDDQEILEVAKKFGADIIIERPSYLATDDATTSDAVKHVFEILQFPENFVLLQPTSPLRNEKYVTECIRFFRSTNAKSVVSVTKSNESPYWTFTIENQILTRVVKTAPFFDQRQKLPTTFVLNGAIYVWETNHFLQNGDFVSAITRAFEMPAEVSIDIDSIEDFERASKYINERTITAPMDQQR